MNWDASRAKYGKWVDKDSTFYNKSMKSCLVDNGIKTNSTHNKGEICSCRKIY